MTKTVAPTTKPQCTPTVALVGSVFGKLTVIDVLPRRYRLCLCECGKKTAVKAYSLTQGDTKSCGCSRGQFTSDGKTVHGCARAGKQTRTYRIWSKLRRRCCDPKTPEYERYGARGITVSDRWSSFENFLADMGEVPPGMSIERINNDGPYAPENCTWATATQQARNRRSCHLVTRDGRTLPLIAWVEELGISYDAVWMRIANGWDTESALTVPLGHHRDGSPTVLDAAAKLKAREKAGRRTLQPKICLICGESFQPDRRHRKLCHRKSCHLEQSRRAGQSSTIDLTGQVFGRLTVVGRTDKRSNHCVVWLCRCSCGTERLIDGRHLRTGDTKSCGCLRADNLRRLVDRQKLAAREARAEKLAAKKSRRTR